MSRRTRGSGWCDVAEVRMISTCRRTGNRPSFLAVTSLIDRRIGDPGVHIGECLVVRQIAQVPQSGFLKSAQLVSPSR